jgi:hypothetical protein
MAQLTYLGQQYALRGNGVGTTGGLYNLATQLRLYLGNATPSPSGTGFNPVTPGNGYAPWPITGGDWIVGVVSGAYRITLTTRSVIASGLIANIAGAYLLDAANNPLAWWERSPVTLQPGGVLVLDQLAIGG